jgi:hypothetical protein
MAIEISPVRPIGGLSHRRFDQVMKVGRDVQAEDEFHENADNGETGECRYPESQAAGQHRECEADPCRDEASQKESDLVVAQQAKQEAKQQAFDQIMSPRAREASSWPPFRLGSNTSSSSVA